MNVRQIVVCMLCLVLLISLAMGSKVLAADACDTSTTVESHVKGEEGWPNGYYTRREVKSLRKFLFASKECPGVRCPCEGPNAVAGPTEITETDEITHNQSEWNLTTAVNSLFKLLTFNFTSKKAPDVHKVTRSVKTTYKVEASCGWKNQEASGTLTVIAEESQTDPADGKAYIKTKSDVTYQVKNKEFHLDQEWDPCTDALTPVDGKPCP